MAWHIQEFGTASAIREKLSKPTATYDSDRDAEHRASVPAPLVPALLPTSTAEDEAVRRAVVAAILAALDEAKGDVHVRINAFGHAQPVVFTDEQLKSLPPTYNKDTRQVTVHLDVTCQV